MPCTTTNKTFSRAFVLLFVIWIAGFSSPVFAEDQIPKELEGIGVEEHLGANVSRSLELKDHHGKTVQLGQYFDGKRPVLLTLVYYNCANLCNFLLNGLTDGLKDLAWQVGDRFEMVTVSIDPTETSDLAAQKRANYLKEYNRGDLGDHWPFLVASEETIKTLSKELGFRFRYDANEKQFAHTAVVFVLTPDGKISRYLYGIQFKPIDLKLAVLEAGEGRVGTVLERLLLFCYHYDPKGNRYALFATKTMKFGAALTVFGLAATIWILSRPKKL